MLLVNLGTPDAPTSAAVRRYLAEFLWDRRVVEVPRALWWLVLHGIILRTLPARSARKYQTIWREDGAPLLAISNQQSSALAATLAAHYSDGVRVALAMRYGRPSIATALAELRATNAQRLLVLPLYPQYSATTSASVFDAVVRELCTWRWLPELRFITDYHRYPPYIEALATSILAAQMPLPAERLLFSFHGLPQSSVPAGDPYYYQCHHSANLIAKRLGLQQHQWGVAFQSRFGPAQWLRPYTSDLLKTWAQAGVQSVDVVCPGFAADCLETLEEIVVENQHVFCNAGGSQYRYLPALNANPEHIAALTSLVQSNAADWLVPA